MTTLAPEVKARIDREALAIIERAQRGDVPEFFRNARAEFATGELNRLRGRCPDGCCCLLALARASLACSTATAFAC